MSLVKVENGKYSSLYLVKQINLFRKEEGNRATLMHYDLLKKIEKEFDEEVADGNISVSYYKDKSGKQSKYYELDYELSVQILVSESKIVRKAVLANLKSFETKTAEGLLLSHDEILQLNPLVEAAFIKEFREKARNSHLSIYLPSNAKGKDYAKANTKRNQICGINREEISKRLHQMNQRSKSLDCDLIKVDKFELIRIAVVDCMLFFGKTKEYSVNIGNLCKKMAIKNERSNFDRANTMYAVPQEYLNTIALLK
jgi:hypothetical protein